MGIYNRVERRFQGSRALARGPYSQIDQNKRRTWLVILLFVGLILGVGYVFSLSFNDGWTWLLLAAVFSLGASALSFFASDRVILAISGASRIKKEDNPRLFRIVENLCIGSGLRLPKIYVIQDTAPNAFATGRDPKRASLAVTTGLLEKLDKLELEGVVAHELSHIKNFDIRLMSIVVILVGMVALLSDWFRRSLWVKSRDREEERGQGIIVLIGLVAAIFAPLIAQLLKLAISREREFFADVSAALLTRYPDGLADALEKISADPEPLEVANSATAHLYIINPLKNFPGKIATLFSTHPPVEERIRRLREM